MMTQKLPDYSSSVIRNFLLTKGLVDKTGKALDPVGIYESARQYEVSASELDAAMGWSGGTAAAWVSENGLLSLDGLSNHSLASVPLPSPVNVPTPLTIVEAPFPVIDSSRSVTNQAQPTMQPTTIAKLALGALALFSFLK